MPGNPALAHRIGRLIRLRDAGSVCRTPDAAI
jgi:hypothetical protein